MNDKAATEDETGRAALGDRELLDRWAAGDSRSGKALVSRHHASIYRFFRAKASSEIDDLVQETFLALVKARGAFRAESSFRSYLFGTARNVLRQHCRRRGRKEDRIDLGTCSAIDLGASPSEALADKAEKQLLLAALRRIPVDDQIVIELYHWEELTATELAEVLGASEAAIRSRLHRAKERLAAAVRQLASSPRVLESTLGDMEGWARQVREALLPSSR
jgi:RNA polymerase sigma-70 factor (ECF subfamily)